MLAGLYKKAVPALIAALERHRAETNPLADQPSVGVLKFALLELGELGEMADYGAQSVAASQSGIEREESGGWPALLDDLLAAAGGLDGAEPARNKDPKNSPDRHYSATPFTYDKVPQRDARFPDPYNMGVNAEALLYDPAQPPEPKVLLMFYKWLREIDVPEMMASILTETKDRPWGCYRDMPRQLWDEARHAMMGEVGFISLGVDWTKCMVNFPWSLGLNTQLTGKERHGVLYFIEQGLMPKTGKRFEWRTAQAAHHALSTLFQDYDWAGEVLHARVGRDWYMSQFESPKEAVEYGDRAWSKVLSGWRQWREEGLTQHRNWWPDVYLAWCRAQNLAPEEKVLAFATTYETQRADLQALAGSA